MGSTTRALDISLTCNLRRSGEDPNEYIDREYADKVADTIASLGHRVRKVEVTGAPDEIIDKLLSSEPELVFNLAEGSDSRGREAYYPAVFEILNIPYTGGGPAIMYVNLDKRLTSKLLEVNGIRVPRGSLVASAEDIELKGLDYPLIVKPNYEGSSLGIDRGSVVEDEEEAKSRMSGMLDEFPAGLSVEEFIEGRELTVPMLEEFPGGMLEIVEYRKKGEGPNILDREVKESDHADDMLETICPAELGQEERRTVLETAGRAFRVMRTPDLGRVDIRLSDEGVPYLIEVTALPGLRPVSPMITAARCRGLDYSRVIEMIIDSAVSRYNL